MAVGRSRSLSPPSVAEQGGAQPSGVGVGPAVPGKPGRHPAEVGVDRGEHREHQHGRGRRDLVRLADLEAVQVAACQVIDDGRDLALGEGVVGRDHLGRHAGDRQGECHHHAGAVLAGRAVHQGGAVRLGDGAQRGHHRVRPLFQVAQVGRHHRPVVGGQPLTLPGQRLRRGRLIHPRPGRQLGPVADAERVGVQRQVVDHHVRLVGQRAGPVPVDLDVGAQVHHPAHAQAADQVPDVGLGEVTEVRRADQHAGPDRPPVRGGQAADVAGVDPALQLDPVRLVDRHGPTLANRPEPPGRPQAPAAEGQKTSSATSMIALSVDSTTLRRATSSGSTVVAKNRATASLPS